MRLLAAIGSFIGAFFGYSLYEGSHLAALVSVYPWVGIIICLFVIIPLTSLIIFRSNKNMLCYALFLSLVGPCFGESIFRILFNFSVLIFALKTNQELSQNEEFNGNFNKSESVRSNIISIFFILVFISYFFSFLTSLWYTLDYEILRANISVYGVKGFYIYLKNNPEIFRSSIFIIEILQTWYLTIYFSNRIVPEDLNKVLGIVLPVFIFILTIFVSSQILFRLPFLSLNQNAFWELTKRYSGTFSDPNSFGVMSGILILLLYQIKMKTIFKICFITLLFLLSLWSGSRTQFILLSLFILFSFSGYLKNRFNSRSSCILIFGLLFVISSVIIWGAKSKILSDIENIPPSLRRVFATIDPENTINMMDSRILYSRIALRGIYEKPLYGYGLDQFIVRQNEIAEKLNIKLDNWRDNANNFYLQVAVESGISGFLLVFSAIIFLVRTGRNLSYFESSEYNSIRLILYCFLFSLLTGPHINFLELRILLSILLSHLFLFAPYHKRKDSILFRNYRKIIVLSSLCISILSSPFIINRSLSDVTRLRGLYGIEINEHGEFFQWGTKSISIPLVKKSSYYHNGNIYIRSPKFYLSSDSISQQVVLKCISDAGDYFYYDTINFSDFGDWIEIPITDLCFSLILSSKNAISPLLKGVSTDNRVLSIQIKNFSKNNI